MGVDCGATRDFVGFRTQSPALSNVASDWATYDFFDAKSFMKLARAWQPSTGIAL